MQDALWDKVLDGDLRAVAAIVRIVLARARLLGFDQATTKPTGYTTVVDPSFWEKLASKTVAEKGFWAAAAEVRWRAPNDALLLLVAIRRGLGGQLAGREDANVDGSRSLALPGTSAADRRTHIGMCGHRIAADSCVSRRHVQCTSAGGTWPNGFPGPSIPLSDWSKQASARFSRLCDDDRSP